MTDELEATVNDLRREIASARADVEEVRRAQERYVQALREIRDTKGKSKIADSMRALAKAALRGR